MTAIAHDEFFKASAINSLRVGSAEEEIACSKGEAETFIVAKAHDKFTQS